MEDLFRVQHQTEGKSTNHGLGSVKRSCEATEENTTQTS